NGAVMIIELPIGGHKGTSRKFSYMFMDAFCNVPPQDGVNDLGAKSLYTNLQINEYEELACLVPQHLLNPQNPAQYNTPCDHEVCYFT
ncbi:3732_t:CDS:2, partial [Paraglomus occultum]